MLSTRPSALNVTQRPPGSLTTRRGVSSVTTMCTPSGHERAPSPCAPRAAARSPMPRHPCRRRAVADDRSAPPAPPPARRSRGRSRHGHRARREERRMEEEPGAHEAARRGEGDDQDPQPAASLLLHDGCPAGRDARVHPAAGPAGAVAAALGRGACRWASLAGLRVDRCHCGPPCTAPVFPSPKPRRRTSVRSVTPQRSAPRRARAPSARGRRRPGHLCRLE